MFMALGTIHYNRAVGLLRGTVEGSISAYQRYYGTPSTGNQSATPATKAYAHQMRCHEDRFIGCFLLQHIKFGPNVPVLSEDGSDDSGTSIFQALREWFIPNRGAAVQITDTKLHNINPNGKSVRVVINELNAIFYEFFQATGTSFNDQDKLNHLMRIGSRMPHISQIVQVLVSEIADDYRGQVVSYDVVKRRLMAVEDAQVSQVFQLQPQVSSYGQPNAISFPSQFAGQEQYGQPVISFPQSPMQVRPQAVGYRVSPQGFITPPSSPESSSSSSSPSTRRPSVAPNPHLGSPYGAAFGTQFVRPTNQYQNNFTQQHQRQLAPQSAHMNQVRPQCQPNQGSNGSFQRQSGFSGQSNVPRQSGPNSSTTSSNVVRVAQGNNHQGSGEGSVSHPQKTPSLSYY